MDATQFTAARKVIDYLVVLPDGTGPVAGHKARRDVNQRRSFHSLREGDHILCSDDVRAQSTLEGGIESNVSGRVDNDVNVVSEALGRFFCKSKVAFSDIAADHCYFVANEIVESGAVTLAQRIERRRGNHVVPEACLRFFL